LSCPASFAVVADDELVMQVVTTFPRDVYLSNHHPFYAENAFFRVTHLIKLGEISTLNLDSNIVKFIGSDNVHFFQREMNKKNKMSYILNFYISQKLY